MTTEIQQPATKSDPWSDLDRLFDGVRQRFFDTFGTHPWVPALVPGEGADGRFLSAARVDVTDTGKAFKIVAEIPGIPKENLDIRVRGPVVEIRGESAKESKPSDASFVHRERTYSGYYRALELEEPVVAADATAKLENGLLELELPKQRPTPAETEVKVSVQ
jgi:HSP20 family protein